MPETLRVPDFERRFELDPASRKERPPTRSYIQIVCIYKNRFDGSLMPIIREVSSSASVSSILRLAKQHDKRLKAKSDRVHEYISTIVQHEDHQALIRRAY